MPDFADIVLADNVPESAYFKEPETLKTCRMYSISRFAYVLYWLATWLVPSMSLTIAVQWDTGYTGSAVQSVSSSICRQGRYVIAGLIRARQVKHAACKPPTMKPHNNSIRINVNYNRSGMWFLYPCKMLIDWLSNIDMGRYMLVDIVVDLAIRSDKAIANTYSERNRSRLAYA